MGRQQRWSTKEEVVLLYGLLNVINKQMPRAKVIKQVSAALRELAKSEGRVVDDNVVAVEVLVSLITAA